MLLHGRENAYRRTVGKEEPLSAGDVSAAHAATIKSKQKLIDIAPPRLRRRLNLQRPNPGMHLKQAQLYQVKKERSLLKKSSPLKNLKKSSLLSKKKSNLLSLKWTDLK